MGERECLTGPACRRGSRLLRASSLGGLMRRRGTNVQSRAPFQDRESERTVADDGRCRRCWWWNGRVKEMDMEGKEV